MDFSGQEHIKAPRAKVWAFVTDPNQIAQCAPGLEDDGVQIVDDDNFKVSVRAGVGMIRANFTFDCQWIERTEPERAVVRASGQASGSSVTMEATMDLADGDEPDTTIMNWSSTAQISGRLAGVGGRLINPVANRMTTEIFDCIRQKLES